MAPKIPVVQLNNGRTIPALGLGTWKSKPGVLTQAVSDAISFGYRHVDCAFIYGNEKDVGEGIRKKIEDKTVRREDLFVTSKLWCTFHHPDDVIPALKNSLSLLGLNHLDLYLIHWPQGYVNNGILFPRNSEGLLIPTDDDYVDTWKAMEEAVQLGLVKSLGLSNFNSQQIQRVIDNGTIKPAVLQLECHPYLNQKKLINFCKTKGIAVTSYSPLGSPDRPWAKPGEPILLDDPKIIAIANHYNKTPAQIVLRFQVQRGLIVIPKSVTKSRIEANMQLFDFELSEEDMAKIDSFDCGGRLVPKAEDKDHPHFPFNIEF